jgi:beta-lactamase superfamily II metal-dependent hydrolase
VIRRVPLPALAGVLALAAAGCPDTEQPPLSGGEIRVCTPDEVEAFRDASEAEDRNDLWMAFLDVGHGDSIWIRTPGARYAEAKEILIDAGNDATIVAGAGLPDAPPAIADFMHVMGFTPEDASTPLDYLVLTHPDADHYGGMRRLIAELGFQVRTYLDPGFEEDNTTYRQLLATVDDAGIEVRRPLVQQRPGMPPSVQLRPDEWGRDLTVTVLSANGQAADKNSASIVLLLEYRGIRILLPGDAETELETELVNAGKLSPINVLKASHHAGETTNTQPFLDRLFPGASKSGRYVVVSAGERDPLPFPTTIDRLLAEVGEGHLYRTDRDDEGKAMAEAPGDDHVLLRVSEAGDLSVCYAFPDPRETR